MFVFDQSEIFGDLTFLKNSTYLVFFVFHFKQFYTLIYEGVTLNMFAIKSPWGKYALMNMHSRNMLAENCPAEKTPLT